MPGAGHSVTQLDPDEADTLSAPLRLMLDVETEESNAHLRLGAAALAVLGGAWLLWVERTEPNWVLILVALASIVFALRWLTAYRKQRVVTATAAAHYLEITAERVILAEGSHQRSISCERIRAIELDEDRLAVVLRLYTGDTVVIEPVYGGLGLRELGETLHRRLQIGERGGGDDPGCTELNQ
jgi:hypothetical protein